jgi:hypothetical protein
MAPTSVIRVVVIFFYVLVIIRKKIWRQVNWIWDTDRVAVKKYSISMLFKNTDLIKK